MRERDRILEDCDTPGVFTFLWRVALAIYATVRGNDETTAGQAEEPAGRGTDASTEE